MLTWCLLQFQTGPNSIRNLKMGTMRIRGPLKTTIALLKVNTLNGRGQVVPT